MAKVNFAGLTVAMIVVNLLLATGYLALQQDIANWQEIDSTGTATDSFLNDLLGLTDSQYSEGKLDATAMGVITELEDNGIVDTETGETELSGIKESRDDTGFDWLDELLDLPKYARLILNLVQVSILVILWIWIKIISTTGHTAVKIIASFVMLPLLMQWLYIVFRFFFGETRTG